MKGNDKIPFDVWNPGCPSRKAFEQIFSRWGILILSRLSAEPQRFGAVRRAVGGISERMLSQTLKDLEEQGLVTRVEWDEKPPRVEYRLSDAGLRMSQRLHAAIQELYGELGRRFEDTEISGGEAKL